MLNASFVKSIELECTGMSSYHYVNQHEHFHVEY